MEVLISLLSPLLGKLAVAAVALIGAFGFYFSVKAKGRAEARAQMEAAAAKARALEAAKLQTAAAKDNVIDLAAAKKAEEIKKDVEKNSAPSGPNRFRF